MEKIATSETGPGPIMDTNARNLLMMLDDNTEILTEMDDQISLSSAAQQCRMVPDKLSPMEVACFPNISSKGDASQKLYLYLRNKILQLWLINCRNELTFEKCMERINEPYNNDADLIRRLHAFLERYGFINFGVFKIEKPIPKANIRIGVIGAGVSGLIAARQLKYFGFDVMVFEGRKEVGGRIRTYQNGRYIADLGAMIVTGLGGNPTAVLARQFPIEFMKIRSRCPLYHSNGNVVPKQLDEQLEREFNRLLEATAFMAHTLKLKKPSGAEFSLGEAMDIVIKLQEKAVLERQWQMWKKLFEMQEKQKAVQRRLFDVRQKINFINLDVKEAQKVKQIRIDNLLEENGAGDASEFPNNDCDLVLEFAVRSKKRDLSALCRDFVGLREEEIEIGHQLAELEELAKCLEEQYLSINDRRLLYWHIANLEYANAASLDQISLHFWDQDDDFELHGSHLSVTNGFIHCADELATPDLNIALNHEVTKINYAGNNCSVEVKNRPDPFVFDAVLCTLPLGVLKESIQPESERPADSVAPNFFPPLPDWKISAIKRLGFGNLNKIVLCFDRIFWDPSNDVFGAVQEGGDEASCGELFQFWSICKEPVLIGLLAGKAANTIEQLNDQMIVGRAISVLRRIFGPNQVPEPKFHAVTRWRKDPYARGSYSYVAVGASGNDYDLLASPVKKDTDKTGHFQIYFAGEHTTRNYPATVHGAILSGLREAGKIADHFLGTGVYADPCLPI